MDPDAKRFARRILLLHLLALVVVLSLVGLASDEIYNNTRDQVIAQAKSRQELLASQTARGIESYYQYILDNLDLVRQTNSEESTTESTATTRSAIIGANQRVIAPGRNPIVSQILWRQLQGRVNLIFSVDGPSLLRDPLVVFPIGSTPDSLTPKQVVALTHQWLESVKTASISPYIIFPTGGANLICAPYLRNRLVVAMVPITAIEDNFLRSLHGDSDSVACLMDEKMTTMAASRPDMAGLSVNQISDTDVRARFVDYSLHGRSGTELVTTPFQIASTAFPPSLISAEPIVVGGKSWELFFFTSTSQVDGILSKLFHRALIWGAVVIICVTTLLVSTAWQLIRSRLRFERVQHEMLTKQLSQAREIQLAWLPVHVPEARQIDVAAINSPASHISGDFYNWFELGDGRLVVTIGDVTGHGMAAAFLMATTQLLVRMTMMRFGDPGKCLAEVNRQLCVQVFNGQFVTMLIAVLDVAKSEVQIGTAGHPPPFLGNGETFRPLHIEPQLVLGVDRNATYVTERFSLPPKSSMLFYTDGVVDCLNPQGDRFNQDGLQRSLHGRFDRAQAMLDQVMGEITTFRGTEELVDDLTLVTIQLRSSATRRPMLTADAGV